jgi:hypothetical protein
MATLNHARNARVAVLALLIACTSTARASAIFAVGTGASCGYATLQQAVTAEAAYHGADDIIYVSRSLTYSAQAISIANQSLKIIGGVDDCNDYTPSGNTTISGNGGAANSVFTIRGNSRVILSNLTISGGDDGGGSSGGGIDFAGTGTLDIANSLITNNHAGYGGGINFNGSGGFAQLDIGSETLITNNTASTSGGGIRIEGNALLRILEPQVFIALNDAQGGYGGGIEVVGPADADLASPGYTLAEPIGLLYENTAQYGGGLAVLAGASDGQDASVRLFTTDTRQPLRISGNSAAHVGGGIYTLSREGADGGIATLCGVDYRVDANSAQEGSAIYVDEHYAVSWGYTGSYVGLNRQAVDAQSYCPGATSASLGAVPCSSDTCNLIDGNVAQNISGQATAGSAVLVQTNSEFTADRIRMQGNHGAHALRAVGGGADESELARANLSNCLMDGNVNSSDLVLGDSLTTVQMNNCTLAYNQIGSGVIARSGGRFGLRDSIVAQGSATTLVYSGIAPNLVIDYVMSLEVGSLSQGTHVTQADPAFVNASQGDFHLLPTSLAIDVAPPVSGDDRDLDGLPHDQDIGSMPNQDGVRDLGAYERQHRYCGASDTVFCSTFDYD